jgi:hypothetical protein
MNNAAWHDCHQIGQESDGIFTINGVVGFDAKRHFFQI